MTSVPSHSDPAIQILRAHDAAAGQALKMLLFNDKPEKYEKWVALLRDPVFEKKYNLPLDAQREQAYARIKRVCDEKLVSIFDFINDPKNIFTAHEMLGSIDGSLATKFTVQFNLFGGTLSALYTDRHLPILKEVDSLKNMGCFCFTELGYGNNAPKMETTATYDPATETFDIHSPSVASQKFWITNGACHANYAVVFAQTIVGGKNEGVSGFIVRIREDDMKPSKGVTIEDMGQKMGLNGIDNGRLMFEHVKIPRENMLNRLADVTPTGKFICDIPKVSNRFFKVADRLLSGRLCISAMCLAGSKAVLYHTIRYSQQRLTGGPTGQSDTPIMSYQLQ
jgi:acyl-CoA oxidase